jgi:hypothetical protein
MFVCMLCMYICMYVCMYLCTWVCMYVYGCTYIRTYVCMYVCIYVCSYVCMMCICMYVRMYVCVCMYLCMYVCTFVCVCMCVCMYVFFIDHAPLLCSNTNRNTNSAVALTVTLHALSIHVSIICRRCSDQHRINDFRCFVINSCLLTDQFPDFRTLFLRSSLCVWCNVLWLSKWSIVWSPLLHVSYLKSVEVSPGFSMSCHHCLENWGHIYIQFKPVFYVWEELFCYGCLRTYVCRYLRTMYVLVCAYVCM